VIRLYEVGPRDGLQGLPKIISVEDRVKMVSLLHDAGIDSIEVGSMVNPNRLPTMANSAEVYETLSEMHPDARYSLLVMNERGMKDALQAKVKDVNIVLSPVQRFNHHNLGKDMHDSMMMYEEMLKDIPRHNVRAYVSCAFTELNPGESIAECLSWANMIASTVVLADTDGTVDTMSLADSIRLSQTLGIDNLALHFHLSHTRPQTHIDTFLSLAYAMGVKEFDSSIAGLGGCPYVDGSGSNLSTEVLVSWALKNGHDIGDINLRSLTRASRFVRNLVSDRRRFFPVTSWAEARILMKSIWP